MKEIWHPEYYPEVRGWSVMKNGFRDSWHHYRKAAQDRCDELNKLDEGEQP